MKEKLTKEQATAMAIEMEKEIIEINSRQYIGMPRSELKDIIMTCFMKTKDLRIFCQDNDLSWDEIRMLARIS